MTEYKPTKKEIIYEMTKIVGKGLKDFGKGFGFGIIVPLTLLGLPTYIRFGLEEDPSKKYPIASHIGGFIAGFPSTIASVAGLAYLVNENPKYALVPLITTNLTSGLYELVRKAKHNLEERLKEEE